MPKTRSECLLRLRETAQSIAPGHKVAISQFRPEDAEGVARLYYTVYEDTFPLDYVYDPERIVEANAGPELYQFVARSESGEVVGVTALFRAAPNTMILESGGLIVHPAYRNSGLALTLNEAALGELPAALGLHAILGQAVCDHMVTQKFGVRFGYATFALEMEAMPGKPATISQQATGPISLLDVFRVFTDQPHAVTLPGAYASWLRRLYARTGLTRTFAAPQPSAGNCSWTRQDMEHAGLEKLILDSVGTDFATVLQDFEQSGTSWRVRHLLLPLTDPAVHEAVEEARRRGYFLAGMLPLWTGCDVLLLQKTAAEPDWNLPRLFTPEAQELLEIVRRDRNTVTGTV